MLKSKNQVETNKYELEIEVSAEAFEEALQRSYLKNKAKITINGFRPGKAPRKIIEKEYGEEVFFEDAVNDVYGPAIEEAVKEAELILVAAPDVEVTEVSKAAGVKFKATCTTKPVVDIKDYKGINVKKTVNAVTDEAVEHEIGHMLEKNSRTISVDSRAAENGDDVVIDFEGFKDGVPFQGGKGENYSLELGSGSFVPGFEDQVIGMKAGEEKELDITFPEDYTPELAGAQVVFKVKVHEVKEKQEPEVDDEFAKDVSEFDTLDEFKKDLGDKLKARRQEQADRDFEAAVIDALIEKLECDVPEAMVDYRADKMLEDYANHIQSQGIKFEDYLRMMGMTMDDMRAQSKAAAGRNVRSDLALEAVVAAEGIEVLDADVEAEVAKLAEQYGMEQDKVRSIIKDEDLRRDLAVRKALELVKSSVKKPAKKAEKAEDKEEKAEKKTAKKAEKAEEKAEKKASKAKKAEE